MLIAAGGSVRGICVTGAAKDYTRKKIDKLTEMIKSYGAKGMVWMKVAEDGVSSSVNKFFTPEQLQAIADHMGAADRRPDTDRFGQEQGSVRQRLDS